MSIFTTFVACKKERVSSNSEKTSIASQLMSGTADFDLQSGVLHNQYMDVAYNKLLQLSNPTYPQCFNQVKETIDLLEDLDGYTLTIGYFENIETADDARSVLNQMKATVTDDATFGPIYQEIGNVLTNVDNSDDFKSAVNDIYAEYADNVSPSEKIKLGTMCSIAISSFDYWGNNYENWGDVYGSITMDDKPKETEDERKKREAKEKKEKFKKFVLWDMTGGSLGSVPGAVMASALCALLWD